MCEKNSQNSQNSQNSNVSRGCREPMKSWPLTKKNKPSAFYDSEPSGPSKKKKKPKFLSKEYYWLMTRSFDSDSDLTRKKDLLQARWVGHTTDQVGLWFVHLSTPRGGDFTQYFCPGVRELHTHAEWMSPPCSGGGGGFKWLVHKLLRLWTVLLLVMPPYPYHRLYP